MSTVVDHDFAAQEAALTSQRLALLAMIGARLHHADDPEAMALTNYFETFDDRAEASQLNEMEIAQLRHEIAELRQVEDALKRLDAGTYGTCASCGEAIAAARLCVLPATRLCLACQEQAEQHSRQPHATAV